MVVLSRYLHIFVNSRLLNLYIISYFLIYKSGPPGNYNFKYLQLTTYVTGIYILNFPSSLFIPAIISRLTFSLLIWFRIFSIIFKELNIISSWTRNFLTPLSPSLSTSTSEVMLRSSGLSCSKLVLSLMRSSSINRLNSIHNYQPSLVYRLKDYLT